VPFNRHQLEPELALFGIEGCEIGFPERVDLAERYASPTGPPP
jgi:hypothetical protein